MKVNPDVIGDMEILTEQSLLRILDHVLGWVRQKNALLRPLAGPSWDCLSWEWVIRVPVEIRTVLRECRTFSSELEASMPVVFVT